MNGQHLCKKSNIQNTIAIFLRKRGRFFFFKTDFRIFAKITIKLAHQSSSIA